MTDSNTNDSLTASSIPSDALPPVEQHAQQYATVRNAHETELIEDYVELIGDLLKPVSYTHLTLPTILRV